MLPTKNFSGRVRPIQTPMLLISKNASTYRVANVPYVYDLTVNPSNWCLWSISQLGGPDLAVRIDSATYVGSYGGAANVYDFYLNNNLVANPSDFMGIFSFKAYGTRFKYQPAFPKATGAWNATYVITFLS